ncbi:trichohyalin-like isoform X3 [Eurytemora carolleeae]|uniref:trichohyalin-like isoform X3 n=1 Tax=Eurytemora carolleeae TaxID=1294199 RepID=UPI000C75E088|nr:trichohyalin-like isoform X3 [Eurytemora carolleeae]|eukprot:XP_023332944.1 trichohyalin-like isoform X3 [Eurytemora affinis]
MDTGIQPEQRRRMDTGIQLEERCKMDSFISREKQGMIEPKIKGKVNPDLRKLENPRLNPEMFNRRMSEMNEQRISDIREEISPGMMNRMNLDIRERRFPEMRDCLNPEMRDCLNPEMRGRLNLDNERQSLYTREGMNPDRKDSEKGGMTNPEIDLQRREESDSTQSRYTDPEIQAVETIKSVKQPQEKERMENAVDEKIGRCGEENRNRWIEKGEEEKRGKKRLRLDVKLQEEQRQREERQERITMEKRGRGGTSTKVGEELRRKDSIQHVEEIQSKLMICLSRIKNRRRELSELRKKTAEQEIRRKELEKLDAKRLLQGKEEISEVENEVLMYTEMVKSKSIQDTSTCSNVDLEFNQSIAKVEETRDRLRILQRRKYELLHQLGEQNLGDDTTEGSSSGLIKDCLEESIQELKKSSTQSLHKLEKELGLLGSVLDQIPRVSVKLQTATNNLKKIVGNLESENSEIKRKIDDLNLGVRTRLAIKGEDVTGRNLTKKTMKEKRKVTPKHYQRESLLAEIRKKEKMIEAFKSVSSQGSISWRNLEILSSKTPVQIRDIQMVKSEIHDIRAQWDLEKGMMSEGAKVEFSSIQSSLKRMEYDLSRKQKELSSLKKGQLRLQAWNISSEILADIIDKL